LYSTGPLLDAPAACREVVESNRADLVRIEKALEGPLDLREPSRGFVVLSLQCPESLVCLDSSCPRALLKTKPATDAT